MTRRSTLKNRTVKRKKPKKFAFHPGRIIGRFGGVFLKVFVFLGVIAVVSVTFLSVYHYLCASPHMRLENVVVRGVGEDLRHELVEAGGLTRRTSMLALNLRAVKNAMEKHPWIRSVTLERQFPHTLLVQVEQEVPEAVVVLDGATT